MSKRRGKEITAGTVRHHLMRLQEDDLIASPQMRHRNTPGRPQHVYALTDKALYQFPNNYQRLASSLLKGMREHIPADGINVILEDVAHQLAQDAAIPDAPLPQRLDVVVDYLNQQGYDARWESCEEGFLLYTSNCPYHQIAEHDASLCEMDMRLVASLLGVVPRRTAHRLSGDLACTYMIPKR